MAIRGKEALSGLGLFYFIKGQGQILLKDISSASRQSLSHCGPTEVLDPFQLRRGLMAVTFIIKNCCRENLLKKGDGLERKLSSNCLCF